MRQSIADLDSKVSEVNQGLEAVSTRSKLNEGNITKMATEINRLKVFIYLFAFEPPSLLAVAVERHRFQERSLNP